MRIVTAVTLLSAFMALAAPIKGSLVRIKLRSGAIVIGEFVGESGQGFLVENGGKTQVVPFGEVVGLDELGGTKILEPAAAPRAEPEPPPPPPPEEPPPPAPPPPPAQVYAPPPEPSISAVVTPEPPRARKSLVRWLPALGGGALAIGGASLFALSRGYADQARTARIYSVHQIVSDGQTFETSGAVLMIVGAAAVATSVVWFFAIPAGSAQVAWFPAPGGGAAVIGGEF